MHSALGLTLCPGLVTPQETITPPWARPGIPSRCQLSRQQKLMGLGPSHSQRNPKAPPSPAMGSSDIPGTLSNFTWMLYNSPALRAWQRVRNASPLPPGWAWMVEEGSSALRACASLQLTPAALRQGVMGLHGARALLKINILEN